MQASKTRRDSDTERSGVDGLVGRTQRRSRTQNEALVLGLLSAAKTPVSAYDIAKMAEASGVNLVPNQVYRTMARLLEQGKVRRIETLNAYVSGGSTTDVSLICGQCKEVQLVPLTSLPPSLAQVIEETGFRPATFVLELLGNCLRCQSDRERTVV